MWELDFTSDKEVWELDRKIHSHSFSPATGPLDGCSHSTVGDSRTRELRSPRIRALDARDPARVVGDRGIK